MMHRTAAIDITLLTTGILLLVSGGLLYVLYRPQTLLLFHVADSMGFLPAIDRWRTCASAWHPPTFVVYSLPAGLWALSYVLIAMVPAGAFSGRGRVAALSLVPVLGAVSELMQAFSVLPGTFDWADLALYIAPLAIIFANTNQKYRT